MNYLVGLGAEKSKLLVGIPLYGQSYRLSSVNQADLGDPTTGPGKPGEFTKQPGMLAYYEICQRIKQHNWKVGVGKYLKYYITLEKYICIFCIKSIKFQARTLISRTNG